MNGVFPCEKTDALVSQFHEMLHDLGDAAYLVGEDAVHVAVVIVLEGGNGWELRHDVSHGLLFEGVDEDGAFPVGAADASYDLSRSGLGEEGGGIDVEGFHVKFLDSGLFVDTGEKRFGGFMIFVGKAFFAHPDDDRELFASGKLCVVSGSLGRVRVAHFGGEAKDLGPSFRIDLRVVGEAAGYGSPREIELVGD